MLQVTDQAASVFKQVVQAEHPDGAIRIDSTPSPEGRLAIQFGVVEQASEGDVRAEAPGIDVFVAPQLVAPLDDAVVDARETQGQAELFVRPREEPAT